MATLDLTLTERVDDLVASHRHKPFRSTTGTHAAIVELIERIKGLELAVHKLAVEVERLDKAVASEW